MAALSSTGIGSGLDVKAIVNALGQADRAPLEKLKTQANQTELKLSALGVLRSKMNDLQTAATAMRNPATWSTLQTKSSNDSAVSAVGVGMSSVGSVTVDVKSIAKAQAMAAGTLFPAGAGWGAGTLRLQMGQWTIVPPSFNSGPGIPVDVDIVAGDTTKDIAAKINSAQSDVRASVLTDSNGAERLFLQGAKTGQSTGFQLSVVQSQGSDSAYNSLSRMSSGAQMGQYGSDARILVDGIEMSSSTNTFAGVAGLDITVKSATATPATLDTSRNTQLATDAAKAFMDAYNSVNDYLAQLTKYDSTTRTAGILQGDATAGAIQNSLRSLMSKTFAANDATSLGWTIERGGSLKMDAAKFAAGLQNNPNGMRALFTSGASSGVADVVRQSMTAALGEGGTLKTKEWTYTQQLTRNKSEQTRVADRAERMETVYTRQFQALDSKLTSMQAITAYWTNQNNQNNSNKF